MSTSTTFLHVTEAATCSCGGEEAGYPLYISLPAIVFLVSLSGLFSGLTLGLLGLDVIGLQIVQKGDDQYLARCAEKIAPVREKGNMLLCTLLLGNVAVNSALSILMADIASGTVGFLTSTALIVIFGEIIPQASCSRYALQIGAKTVPLVKLLMYSPLFLFTKPLSVCLDLVLGAEVGTIHSRTELMEMLKLQIRLGACGELEGEAAKRVAEGALNFRDRKVGDVLTPLEDAYMLRYDVRLGYDLIREIFETGFTRVPVYGSDKNDYRGLLYTKDLMLADPEDEMQLGDFIQIFNRKVETVFRDTTLVEVLSIFKKGGTHMGIVRTTNTTVSTNPTFEILGVLTLEDVVEEILQDEIVDETDVYVDVDNRVKVTDGRANKKLDLAIFNPAWRAARDRLSQEEISAIGRHLSARAFVRGTKLHLTPKAIEYLVTAAEVSNKNRATACGIKDALEADMFYRQGKNSDHCTLILQGRLAARVGREGFRSELGAFSLLALDALWDDQFVPDFDAFIITPKVRYLTITRTLFAKAQALDLDSQCLDRALCSLAEEARGEGWRKHGKTRADSSESANSRRLKNNCGCLWMFLGGHPHPSKF